MGAVKQKDKVQSQKNGGECKPERTVGLLQAADDNPREIEVAKAFVQRVSGGGRYGSMRKIRRRESGGGGHGCMRKGRRRESGGGNGLFFLSFSSYYEGRARGFFSQSNKKYMHNLFNILILRVIFFLSEQGRKY